MPNTVFKSVYIQGNVLKDKIPAIVEKLYVILRDYEMSIYFDYDLENVLSENFKSRLPQGSFRKPDTDIDLGISLGGDGTVLRAIQQLLKLNIPILSVNMGGLGFLTEVKPEEMSTKLADILQGEYFVDQRSLLQITVVDDDKVFYGLNEAVIDKAASPKVLFFNTSIDGKFFNNYIADGLIVSTPTGSTGYSLSANGPLLMPDLDAHIISPICPHSLTHRPMVIPSDKIVEIEVCTDYEYAQLIVDGEYKMKLHSRQKVRLENSRYGIKLIRHKHSHFFNILRNKLHWGDDLRTKERRARYIAESSGKSGK